MCKEKLTTLFAMLILRAMQRPPHGLGWGPEKRPGGMDLGWFGGLCKVLKCYKVGTVVQMSRTGPVLTATTFNSLNVSSVYHNDQSRQISIPVDIRGFFSPGDST